jgi:16S rRNA (cytosine967-C5)-methyltransferase
MQHLRLCDHQLAAASIVHDVIFKQQSLSGLLPIQEYNNKPIPPQDRAMIQHLVYTTLRHWGHVKGCLRQICEKAPPEPLIALIGVALIQLFWHSQKTAQIVDQAVEACRFMGLPAFSKLTNAVLRRALREKDDLLALNTKDITNHLSCPTWWYKKLTQQYGQDATRTMLESSLKHPPMTLRVNPRFTKVNDYLELLKQAELSGTPVGLNGIILKDPVSVYQLPHFKEGWVSVQDAGAQYAPELLAPEPHARVLDACAAPGGKTAHLLERYPTIQMVALDHDAERISQLNSTLHRLQLKPSYVGTADAGDKAKRWWNKQLFDAILLDVPCSGSGVIRRHPDIKWLRQPEDLEGFARQQKRLLNNLWETLKPGGVLLYITCSLFQEENQDVIQAFLAKTPDAERIRLVHPALTEQGQLLLSDINDGFFYAKLRKKP